jgi:hypothetical protein
MQAIDSGRDGWPHVSRGWRGRWATQQQRVVPVGGPQLTKCGGGEQATQVIENLGLVGQVAAEHGEEARPHGGRVWWG